MLENNASHHVTATTEQSKPSAISGDPTSFDILLGKERASFNHSGNKRFRVIINQNLDRYMTVPTKTIKSRLIRDIYDEMKKTGFRFFKKDNHTDTWHEINDQLAREKVSHALRDRVKELKKPLKRRSEQILHTPFASTQAEKLSLSRATTEPIGHWSKNPDASDDDNEPIPLDNEAPTRQKRRLSLLSFGGFSERTQQRRNGLIVGRDQNAVRRGSIFSIFNSSYQPHDSRLGKVARTSVDKDVHTVKHTELNPEDQQMSTSFNSSFFNLFGSDDQAKSTRPPLKKQSSLFSLFGTDNTGGRESSRRLSNSNAGTRPMMTKQSSIFSLFGSDNDNSTSKESDARPALTQQNSIYSSFVSENSDERQASSRRSRNSTTSKRPTMTKQSSIFSLFGSDNDNSTSNESDTRPPITKQSSIYSLFGSDKSDERQSLRRLSNNISAAARPTVSKRNSLLGLLGPDNFDARESQRRTSLNASFFNLFASDNSGEREYPRRSSDFSSDLAKTERRSSISTFLEGVFASDTDEQPSKRQRLSLSTCSPQDNIISGSGSLSEIHDGAKPLQFNRRLSVTGLFGDVPNDSSGAPSTKPHRRCSVESLSLEDFINGNEKYNRRSSMSNLSLSLGSVTFDDISAVKLDHSKSSGKPGSVNLLDSLLQKYEPISNNRPFFEEDADKTLDNLIENFGTQYQNDNQYKAYSEDCRSEFSRQIPVDDTNFSFN